MKAGFFFFFITSLLFNCHTYAFDKIQLQARTISVSPYGIIDDSHRHGIYYELLNKLFAQENIILKNRISPYIRIMQDLKQGSADVTIMFKYPEMEPYVNFISPLPALKNVVIGGNNFTIKSINNLQGKTLAYLRGAKFNQELDRNEQIYKHWVNDFEQGVKLLESGRADAIIGPESAIVFAAKRQGISMKRWGEPFVVSKKTPWLQVSKKSRGKIDIDSLKLRFENMLESGELTSLYDSYLNL